MTHNILSVDHVMFPVYHNPDFLNFTKKYWKIFSNNITSQNHNTFFGVYLFGKDFYVEHLSVNKKLPAPQQYWSNSLCIALDTKYWHRFKKPFFKSEQYLTPYVGCGYFLINPKYQHKKKSSVKLKILISKSLKKEIEMLTKMKLPSYIKTHKLLLHNYDIVVTSNKNKLVAPLLQSNFPLVSEFGKTIF